MNETSLKELATIDVTEMRTIGHVSVKAYVSYLKTKITATDTFLLHFSYYKVFSYNKVCTLSKIYTLACFVYMNIYFFNSNLLGHISNRINTFAIVYALGFIRRIFQSYNLGSLIRSRIIRNNRRDSCRIISRIEFSSVRIRNKFQPRTVSIVKRVMNKFSDCLVFTDKAHIYG
ncbi:putative multidrug resistance-associated protein lethal(2)03659 isoform X1 [Vespula squamosa]|uniref:Multidrug resistance-associated protein lethal(2)03659 isoform X1 n=1 Tax=Vespula squamosa TaxID=30214 RepID=A0ABD2BG47_VESSQ